MQVPLLVDDFLRRATQVYADKTAVIDGNRRFTYRELGERVNRLSNALLELGVSQGDRVCILSPNSHFFLESFYATSQNWNLRIKFFKNGTILCKCVIRS